MSGQTDYTYGVEALGTGIYTMTEAARLAGVSPRRAKAWFTGGTPNNRLLAHSDYATIDRPDLVSFLDLMDVLVVGQLRENHVSFRTIQKAYKALQGKLDTTHPFGHQELMADTSGTLFIYAADQAGGDKALVELFSGQAAFPKLLLRYLKRVRFDPKTRLARRYELTDTVAIDAARRFGKPIVSSCGMATSILAAAFKANDGDADAVADWYGVEPREVHEAVDFEQSFAGIAA